MQMINKENQRSKMEDSKKGSRQTKKATEGERKSRGYINKNKG